MKILQVGARSPVLMQQLFEVWEKSVKETHTFLSDAEINEIAKFVPDALRSSAILVVLFNEEGIPVGFMGITGNNLDSLFISPDYIGKGFGKQLLQLGIEAYSINELAVNEQNPQARGFYEHLGFRVFRRSDTDEQGNPYPILYMRL